MTGFTPEQKAALLAQMRAEYGGREIYIAKRQTRDFVLAQIDLAVFGVCLYLCFRVSRSSGTSRISFRTGISVGLSPRSEKAEPTSPVLASARCSALEGS